MTNRMKATVSLLFLILGFGTSAASFEPKTVADKLQVYAGPQTALPGENISVTIEMTDSHGKSAQGETIELTYISDGEPVSLSGNVQNGLVSFDVEAQSSAGGMVFQALSGDLESNNATVQIVAAQPKLFKLNVKSSRNSNFVELTTETLTDAFGNPISDQNLVELTWIDDSGTKRSEAAQLSNSRIAYTSICPSAYEAPLKIRAVLKNTEVFSSDLSNLCGAQGKRA